MDVRKSMKHLVINDFDFFIKRLLVGYTEPYDHILNKILFIDTACRLDKVSSIYEKLL